MKHKKLIKIFSIIAWIVAPFIINVIYAIFDLGMLFNQWEEKILQPDWRYVWLILYKLFIYIIPPLIGMIGFYIENKDKKGKHRFIYYYVKSLNLHFLILLSLKFISDSILELDAIWNFKLFNSINDIQALAGYALTLLLKQNIKIEPGLDEPEAFKK